MHKRYAASSQYKCVVENIYALASQLGSEAQPYSQNKVWYIFELISWTTKRKLLPEALNWVVAYGLTFGETATCMNDLVTNSG